MAKYRFPDRAAAEAAYANEAEKTLRLGQALRMLADGVRPVRFTVKGADGDRFVLRYIPGFRNASDGVVLFNRGGDTDDWMLADAFLAEADAEVSAMGREYSAFDAMRRWLRDRVRESIGLAMAV